MLFVSLRFQDLAPYLGSVVPGLKQALLDPVPEVQPLSFCFLFVCLFLFSYRVKFLVDFIFQVRALSSRALGAMVRGMGEESFEDLLPWLMETLTSENSSVDRSGAAQGNNNC